MLQLVGKQTLKRLEVGWGQWRSVEGITMEKKTITHFAVVMSAVMQPNQANPAGNVHGGEMKLCKKSRF